MLEIDKQTILDLTVSIDNLTSAITCLEKDSRPQNTNQRQSKAIAYIDEIGRAGRTVTWSDMDKIRRILRS